MTTPTPSSPAAAAAAASASAAAPTAVAPPAYAFFTSLARMLNAGQTHSVLLYGNVYDLFHVPDKDAVTDGMLGETDGCAPAGAPPADPAAGDYVPLISFLCHKGNVPGLMLLVYELNGPIRMPPGDHWDKLRNAWMAWRTGVSYDDLVLQSLADRDARAQRQQLEADFNQNVQDAVGRPTVALEFLRQLALCSRSTDPRGRHFLAENLLIIIEAADMVIPAGDGEISRLNPADRQRVSIVQDWFSDPGFMNGRDSVITLAESRSLVHPRVSRLPQVLSVQVPAPDLAAREHYIQWFMTGRGAGVDDKGQPRVPRLWAGPHELARLTAGLSIHALRQLLIGAAHTGQTLTHGDIVAKVEQFIQTQLGDDVVEFKKPHHSLDDVIGFTNLKQFLCEELIPRFRSTGPDALGGAAVAGPIGGGKTFIFEAVAASLDLPVLVLKNIRSQWYGQTDVIFERLRRVLEALGKVVIFVDEADTQFGGVGPDTLETERRLTGKIQQMMSDPQLRGKVIWLLMTARIHRLSADIRRPGRVGDLIIPVLDPQDEDRKAFLRWTLAGALDHEPTDDDVDRMDKLMIDHSAAAFASLRSHLKAKALGQPLAFEAIEQIVHDHLPPAIEQTRRYQTLQAMVNCTRRSLLPDPEVSERQRLKWHEEIRELERMGMQ